MNPPFPPVPMYRMRGVCGFVFRQERAEVSGVHGQAGDVGKQRLLVESLPTVAAVTRLVKCYEQLPIMGTPYGWMWPKWPKNDVFIDISSLFQSH